MKSEDLIATHRDQARLVSSRAHAPYSGFKVGAVLVDGEGQTHIGCNVESASYGLTQCAERNALAGAMADGVTPGDGQFMLVYVSGQEPWPPCGACRQVMLELMSPDALIVSCCDGPDHIDWKAADLMPKPFKLRDL